MVIVLNSNVSTNDLCTGMIPWSKLPIINLPIIIIIIIYHLGIFLCYIYKR